MSRKDRLDEVLRDLKAGQASMRCQDLIAKLSSLGFEVRDGGKQGHKVVTHAGIPGFLSTAFTCGHGRNPEIKPAYVAKIRKLLLTYEAELTDYLETNDEH